MPNHPISALGSMPGSLTSIAEAGPTPDVQLRAAEPPVRLQHHVSRHGLSIERPYE